MPDKYLLQKIREFFYIGDDGQLWGQRGKVTATSEKGYIVAYIRHPLDKNKRHKIKSHHIVWYLHHGQWPTFINHIDHDKTNNKIDNLELSNPHHNMLAYWKNKNPT